MGYSMEIVSEKKRKILFVITKSNFGGAQRYVYDVATSLSPQYFDVTVAFGGTGIPNAGAGILQTMLARAHIRTFFIQNFARDIFIFKEFGALFELIALFRKERPDVVHLNSSKAGGLGALAARIARVPRVVFTAHGWPHQEPRNSVSRALIYFFSWLTVLLAHHTIVVSHNDGRVVPALFKRKSVQVIHNGIEAGATLKIKKDARRELETISGETLPDDEIWIMTVAEFTKNKNHRTLIRALQHIPGACLILIGAGEMKDTLKRLARTLNLQDRVHFIGQVPRANEYVLAADIFVLPSLKEGFPYTILEAGVAGLPVVASSVGGIPEIIEHEQTGLLVPPKDPLALAEALKRLIADEPFRRKLGASLKQKIQRNFSLDSMLRKTITLYQ